MESIKSDINTILADGEKFAKDVVKNSAKAVIEKITVFGKDIVEELSEKLENKYDDIELLIKKASRDFGINSGKLVKVLLINDNPYADVFLSVKAVFDLTLVSLAQALSVVYVVFFNKSYEEIEKITSRFFILDDLIINSFSSLENGLTNLFVSSNQRAIEELFTWVEARLNNPEKSNMTNDIIISKLDEYKTKIQATMKTIIVTFVSEFFDSFTKDFQKKRGKVALENKEVRSLVGGTMKTLKRRKSVLLKRVKTHIHNYNNTNKTYKVKSVRRRK
jgi:uncharacterized protein YlzI (FlbEa/FlbD family)